MVYKCRTKIWITDPSNDVIFGMGRVKILEAIERHGSINAAAMATARLACSEPSVGTRTVAIIAFTL